MVLAHGLIKNKEDVGIKVFTLEKTEMCLHGLPCAYLFCFAGFDSRASYLPFIDNDRDEFISMVFETMNDVIEPKITRRR